MKAELRNAVYAYALESCMSGRRTYLRHVPGTFNRRTCTFVLTQACRKVRKEFQPLHIKTKHVAIRLQDLSEYLSIFYPGTDDEATGAEAAGKLEICLERAVYKEKIVDMLPFIKLVFRAPNFQCRFGIFHKSVDETELRRAANLNVMLTTAEEFSRCEEWLKTCRIHLTKEASCETGTLPTITVVFDSSMFTSPAHKYPYNDLAFIRTLEAFGNFRIVKQKMSASGCAQDFQLVF
jgi:hypothetical protein